MSLYNLSFCSSYKPEWCASKDHRSCPGPALWPAETQHWLVAPYIRAPKTAEGGSAEGDGTGSGNDDDYTAKPQKGVGWKENENILTLGFHGVYMYLLSMKLNERIESLKDQCNISNTLSDCILTWTMFHRVLPHPDFL